mmetsp:Transcript_20750/g.65456  ORF Transcript_20750/g.65456 Transcript_20750/m.65456 type:complete len:233 (-) Transcript_20750:59-757(-)
MADEAGWQRRLCATLCAPPIARLHFSHRTPFAEREFPQFQRRALLCLGLGIARSYLNAQGALNDFMSGGTDLFSAGLALCAVFDVCHMNGSFLAMFIIWALVNAFAFDLIFSLGPNLMHGSMYWSTDGQAAAFVVDNILILVNTALQVMMARQANAILEDVLPNWKDQITYGVQGRPPPGPAAQQPLLGRPVATSMWRAQPPGAAASGGSGTQPFRAFSGSGQRLGGGGHRT